MALDIEKVEMIVMDAEEKLGKTTDQRMAMLRQQVTDFLDKGRMETTVTRAKEIAPLAETMITLGKAKDLAAYRQALAFITREDVVKKVFKSALYLNTEPSVVEKPTYLLVLALVPSPVVTVLA